MFQDVLIATELKNSQVADEAAAALKELPWVKLCPRQDLDRSPEIILLNDDQNISRLVTEIAGLRQSHPTTEIFVISSEKNPDYIVDVIKAGASEFFVNRLNPQKLREAVEKVRAGLSARPAAVKGRLYSFISAKGGLGATVVSVNTAAALALRNKGSVALLDMSLQSGDSSVYLDTLPQTTLADICKNFHRLDFSFLKTSMLRHSTGLHYLAAPREPEDSMSVHGAQVKKVLHLAKSLYDQVVVDCTSMLVDECSLEAFQASDRIFILTDLSVPAVRNAARLNQLMQKLRIAPGKVEIVVNRFTKGGTSLQDVEGILKKSVFWLFPNEFEDVIGSINAGIPLVKSKPGSPFAKNILEFIDKMPNPPAPPGYRGAKGFLGKAI